MKGFVKTLVLLACMMALLCSTALADETVNSLDGLRQAFAKTNPGTIMLAEDIVFSGNSIEVNGTAVLDLNGKVITVNSQSALFGVGNGDRLTIRDTQTPKISTKKVRTLGQHTAQVNEDHYGLGAKRSGKTFTWYETLSTVNSDGISTTETVYEKSSSNMGAIVAGSNVPRMANVNRGRLVLESGTIYGFTGSAIHVSNDGHFEMDGGYLLGNQSTWDGGAVYLTGNGTSMNMDGGVMSGNKAANNGGAIFMTGGGIAQMNGGLLTNNEAIVPENPAYESGGGAVMIDTFKDVIVDTDNNPDNGLDGYENSVFVMTGGQITSNVAFGGGGVRTKAWWNGTSPQDASFTMTGGVIANNVALGGEGAGVSINGGGYCYIMGDPYKGTKSYITNNSTNHTEHWGGGGLFCADQSWIYMDAALIADNVAGGFGGGVAGCSTGRIDTVSVNVTHHGAAIYDNNAKGTNLSGNESTKSEDHLYTSGVFQQGGYKDYFCALSSHVCGSMLGGGSAEWTGSVDGTLITDPVGKDDPPITAVNIAGLISHPVKNDKEAAENLAGVFVTGNYSYTHGGGVLCNGYLLFDQWQYRTVELGDRLMLEGTKHVYNEKNQPIKQSAGAYTFNVYEANSDWTLASNQPVSVGTNRAVKAEDAAGGSVIDFDKRLIFEEAGTYRYVIREAVAKNPAVQIDKAEYRLTVTVVRDGNSSSHGPITVAFNRISHLKLVKVLENGNTETVFDQNVESWDNSAVTLNRFSFTNREENITRRAELVVNKLWEGGTERPAIKVYLKEKAAQGGTDKTVDTATLSVTNKWTYTFTGLDPDKTYTVEEDVPEDYTASYEKSTSTRTENNVTTTTTTINIKNTRNSEEVKKAQLRVNKIWEGGSDRPEITVNLRLGGNNVKSAKLNKDNNWTYLFTDLDLNGVYTISEEVPNGYTATYSAPVSTSETVGHVTTTTTTIIITNTKVEEKKQNVVVTKKWLGGDTHPASITVELYDGKTLVDTRKLSAQNNWTYAWGELPLSGGYNVKEVSVSGYTGTCETFTTTDKNGTLTQTFVLTNMKDEIINQLEDMPQTGDHSSMGFWMAAMTVSCAAFVAISRKKKED